MPDSTQSDLARKLEKLGWTLHEAREPQVREVAGRKNAVSQVIVEEGYFSASKRHTGGNTLVQFESDTETGLLAQVEGWENEQTIATAEPNPDEKAYKDSQANSHAATEFHASPTGANRPAE